MAAYEVQRIFELPLETLVVLGAGYMAYVLAYAGLRDHHKPLDVLLSAISFGLIAKGVFSFLGPQLQLPLLEAIFALTVTLAAAMFWRKKGSAFWADILRDTGVSHSDDTSSALDRIRTDTGTFITQLTVHTDEVVLQCSDLFAVKELPHGPCILGKDGSVSMYADGVKLSGGDWEDKDVSHVKAWGPKLTYIPASEVRRIEVRTIQRNEQR